MSIFSFPYYVSANTASNRKAFEKVATDPSLTPPKMAPSTS